MKCHAGINTPVAFDPGTGQMLSCTVSLQPHQAMMMMRMRRERRRGRSMRMMMIMKRRRKT